MNSSNPQLVALFTPTDIIGFKQDLFAQPTYVEQGQPSFFFINPLKACLYGKGAGEASNIREYRNILIEWDQPDMPIERQWEVAHDSKLPWTTCVYSGGKSLHFVISLSEPFETAEQYTYFARLAMKALNSDTSMSNVNRISRLAGSTRDNGVLQELIEVRTKVTKQAFLEWLLYSPFTRKKVEKIQREEAEQMREQAMRNVEDIGPKTILPTIYKKMCDEGALHPNSSSRHESLVLFGTWLKANWHDEGEIEELLVQAATAMGIEGRGDHVRVLRWLGI